MKKSLSTHIYDFIIENKLQNQEYNTGMKLQQKWQVKKIIHSEYKKSMLGKWYILLYMHIDSCVGNSMVIKNKLIITTINMQNKFFANT